MILGRDKDNYIKILFCIIKKFTSGRVLGKILFIIYSYKSYKKFTKPGDCGKTDSGPCGRADHFRQVSNLPNLL